MYSISGKIAASSRNSAAWTRLRPWRRGVLGQLGDGLEQWERNVLADDGGGLEEALSSNEEPVDPGREHGLDGGRHLDGVQRLRQVVACHARPRARASRRGCARSPRGRTGCRRASSMRRCLAGPSVGSLPSSASSRGVGAAGGQLIDPELGVVSSCFSHPWLIRGPVVHEQQQARPRESPPRGCRAGPGSRRRSSADPRRGPAAAGSGSLGGGGGGPRPGYADGAAEDRAPPTGGRRRARPGWTAGPAGWAPACPSSDRSLPVTFSPIFRGSSLVLDLEVRLEEVDERQVRGGLRVRNGAALEDQPAAAAIGADKLPEERDFPTPASPTSATTWPWPDRASSSAW